MERSLHRVSLGSRRAHPDLSFYLTTYGKCLWARLHRLLPLLSTRRRASPQGDSGREQALFLFGALL
jgi:hypothetical protein